MCTGKTTPSLPNRCGTIYSLGNAEQFKFPGADVPLAPSPLPPYMSVFDRVLERKVTGYNIIA